MFNDYHLKDIEKEDLDIALKWRNSEVIRSSMYTDHQITSQEHKEWFKKVTSDPNTIVKIFQYNGKPLGLVNFSDIDQKNSKCYWGFYIGEQTAPAGSGSILGFLALEFIFEKVGIRKLCAEVLATNVKSLKFHKKLGFMEEGRLVKHILKNGQYIDIIPMAVFPEKWSIRKKDLISAMGGTNNDNH